LHDGQVHCISSPEDNADERSTEGLWLAIKFVSSGAARPGSKLVSESLPGTAEPNNSGDDCETVANGLPRSKGVLKP
jgi:hypothetical protein